jgi:hypothetical protein
MVAPITFLIGNGTSRLKLPDTTLREFRTMGYVVGCNAIYRTHPGLADSIVAVDQGMIDELHSSGIEKDRIWSPTPDMQHEPAECNPGRPRTNAGVHAIREIIRRMPYMCLIIGIGFDFLIADSVQSVSNVYDGTQNYGMDTRANARDNVNRVRFLEYVMNREAPGEMQLLLAYPDYCRLLPITSPKIKTTTFDKLFVND